MADVTGPISSMPGSTHRPPHGTDCDNHKGRQATVRIQGETDSFGSEMHDLCAECAAPILEHAKKPRIGFCEWCKGEGEIKQYRDMDEGMAGRLYDVCSACRKKDRDAAEEEAQHYREYNFSSLDYE